MARIVFTANIQRHVACPEAEAVGRTVREVLENVFDENPQARGYSSTTRRRCASTWRSSSMGRSSAIAHDSPTPCARPAGSTSSKPCQEADDERYACHFDPQRPIHGVAQGGAVGDHGHRFSGRQCLHYPDRPTRRTSLCGSRSWAFWRQAPPLDGNRLGRDRCSYLSAQAGRLRGVRHVESATELEHGTHLGAPVRRTRRARRHLVRNAPGRPVPLDRPWAELGDDPRALGSSQAQAMDGGWRRSAGYPFDLRRSTQFKARVGRCLDRGPSG